MCSNCTRAHLRSKLRSLMISLLVLIFFSLMAYDLLGFDEVEPTDTNVEMLMPPELECNDPHGYYCDPVPAPSANL